MMVHVFLGLMVLMSSSLLQSTDPAAGNPTKKMKKYTKKKHAKKKSRKKVSHHQQRVARRKAAKALALSRQVEKQAGVSHKKKSTKKTSQKKKTNVKKSKKRTVTTLAAQRLRLQQEEVQRQHEAAKKQAQGVNLQDLRPQDLALIEAIRAGDFAAVKQAIANGANPNLRLNVENKVLTPLIIAVLNGHRNSIVFLKERAGDLTKDDMNTLNELYEESLNKVLVRITSIYDRDEAHTQREALRSKLNTTSDKIEKLRILENAEKELHDENMKQQWKQAEHNRQLREEALRARTLLLPADHPSAFPTDRDIKHSIVRVSTPLPAATTRTPSVAVVDNPRPTLPSIPGISPVYLQEPTTEEIDEARERFKPVTSTTSSSRPHKLAVEDPFWKLQLKEGPTIVNYGTAATSAGYINLKDNSELNKHRIRTAFDTFTKHNRSEFIDYEPVQGMGDEWAGAQSIVLILNHLGDRPAAQFFAQLIKELKTNKTLTPEHAIYQMIHRGWRPR